MISCIRPWRPQREKGDRRDPALEWRLRRMQHPRTLMRPRKRMQICGIDQTAQPVSAISLQGLIVLKKQWPCVWTRLRMTFFAMKLSI